jgi:hypothetical protein
VRRTHHPPPLPEVWAVLAGAAPQDPRGVRGWRVALVTFSVVKAQRAFKDCADAWESVHVVVITLEPMAGWQLAAEFRPPRANGFPANGEDGWLSDPQANAAIAEGWHYCHVYPGSDYMPGSADIAFFVPCPLEELFRE